MEAYHGFPRTGAYRTILADPPWPYEQKLKGARGELPYESMTEAEILGLPVGEAAAPDCLLLLWTTNSHLPLALRCVERWGFTYRVVQTWGKVNAEGRTQIGLGYWLRGATEHLIVASKGHPRERFTGPHGGTGKAWSTLLLAPRREHSQKPDEVYAMAEDIGSGPRLELFARYHRGGWDTWGNVRPKAGTYGLGAFGDPEVGADVPSDTGEVIPLGPGRGVP